MPDGFFIYLFLIWSCWTVFIYVKHETIHKVDYKFFNKHCVNEQIKKKSVKNKVSEQKS